MKKAIFTICAKNYIGLAQTLEASVKTRHSDIDFYIFVSDEIDAEDSFEPLAANIIIARDVLDIPRDQWYEMCFKYDLTEFATAIKPSCFKYLFNKVSVEKCIFFDPDILVYNSLDSVYNQLDSYSIILTPHITSIEDIYTGALEERKLFYSGMYNLGFLALKNDGYSKKLLSWWEIRLKDRCFQDLMENYFTDQKWMDFIPSFFPEQALVSKDLGLNLAPWNFHEREIITEDSTFFVQRRNSLSENERYPLTFVHFSGFNYSALLNDEVVQGNIKDLPIAKDLEKIFEVYTASLRQGSLSKFIGSSYSYNSFSNKVTISKVYRRLFRRLLSDGKINLNPFDSNSPFYQSLKKGGVLDNRMASADKIAISNVGNAENKALTINKLFFVIYKLIGPKFFFQLTKLMRLYSKIENHPYLVDKSYFKKFKIWH